MSTQLQKMKWNLHQYKIKKILTWGLKHGYIVPYNSLLIEKLRNIYDGGIPASILLLSNGMSNGVCYDRALLMSRAFLDEDGDVKLVYASIDSLRLNPQFIKDDDPLYADHCIVERTTKDGQHVIYDTTSGFIYDKNIYWMMENPKVRKIDNKDTIIKSVKSEENYHPEDIERDKYALPLKLPMIERAYESPIERYSSLLQREIGHFKQVINYDGVCQEIKEDMKKMGMRK